jgi:hypothetical protein
MKKLSAGLMFLSIVIISLSVIRLIFTQSVLVWYGYLPGVFIVLIIIYAILNNIIRIVAAVNILRKREWARRLLVFSTAVWIGYTVLAVMPLNARSIDNIQNIPEYAQMIDGGYESLTPEIKQKAQLSKEDYTAQVLAVIHRVNIIFQIISLLYLGSILFIFTRNSVKLQFNSNTKAAE